MNTRSISISVAGALPAQKIDASGIARVDQRAVLALALPLMALYEGSIWSVKWVEKKATAAKAASTAAAQAKPAK